MYKGTLKRIQGFTALSHRETKRCRKATNTFDARFRPTHFVIKAEFWCSKMETIYKTPKTKLFFAFLLATHSLWRGLNSFFVFTSNNNHCLKSAVDTPICVLLSCFHLFCFGEGFLRPRPILKTNSLFSSRRKRSKNFPCLRGLAPMSCDAIHVSTLNRSIFKKISL